MYKLYCFAQSGNAYKAALALSLMDADWEPVFVDFFNGGSRSPDFLALNEMGEVPVLVDGETTLTQSAVILDYLSSKHGTYGATSAEMRREILRWMLWDNHKLTGNIATGRFLMNFLPEEKRDPGVIAFLMGRAHAAMKTLERHLEGRDWIVGEALTIADLSCVGYLYFTDEFQVDMNQFPNIDRWRSAIAALPGWKHPYDLMPGHPLEGA
ncbi:glutathione S-transferase family protein [Halovulum sp. GXIMD14793]